jgi:uncharacterized protein
MTLKRLSLPILKRLILTILTLLVVFSVGILLVNSWSEPQISSRLQLYQTDLILTASELQQDTAALDLTSASKAILGADPIAAAQKEYQTARQSAEVTLKQFQTRLDQLTAPVTSPPITPVPTIAPVADSASRDRQLRQSVQQQQDLIDQLDLRMGLLQAKTNQTDQALKIWQELVQRSQNRSAELQAAQTQTAIVLQGLWSQPPRLLPDAETQIQQHLDGWFRYTALTQLYQLQQRSDALTSLQVAAQQTAQQTLVKLVLVGIIPVLGCLAGAILLVSLLIQRLTQGKDSVLSQHEAIAWEVPWDGEIVWQVLIVGFFFIGQLVLPQVLSLASPTLDLVLGLRSKPVFALAFYLSMATSTLLVLYFSIRQFLPLPAGWFQLKGNNRLLWGIGGYLVALPLVVGISLVNERLWRGQGGSNPLLQLVLEEGDRVSLAIFLFTAAIAAPIFEEILFRGFLLPSLTRYLPVWGAIALSSLIFATAHLSVSEVLPLTVLGSVLGFVYTRSRSLLSPMLLHSLWNSVTMVGLFILGSGTK